MKHHHSQMSRNLPFVIHDYRFLNLIGKGGFAEVYLVQHTKFGQHFVAKVMTVDPSEMQSRWEIFDAETTALSTLNHPNIIRLYEHFSDSNQFIYILEYCPCGSLHDEVAGSCGLPFPRFLALAQQIVSALSYCHSKGIAHRDIKPGNILLDESHRAKVADFGLSQKTIAGQLHKSFSGSCEYTAPEIFLRRPHDPMKGDVWALGVVFAIMATGSSPWKSDSLGGLRQLASTGNYKLSKSIHPMIADIISRMIVVNPDGRIKMEDIEKHPLFSQQCPESSQKVPRQVSKIELNSKIKWDQIERIEPIYDDRIEDGIDFEDEFTALRKVSRIHSASSSFMHSPPKVAKVRSRLHPIKRLETFSTIEDVTEFALVTA